MLLLLLLYLGVGYYAKKWVFEVKVVIDDNHIK